MAVFGHQKKSRGTQVLDSLGSLDKLGDRLPGKLDSYAAGLLTLGMVNWLTTSLVNFDAVQAAAGKKSVPGRALYGALGLAGIYATARGARKAS
jgi:uncharacterized membrane protein YuzA (DUF378 family)